jgi:hypothetical protein
MALRAARAEGADAAPEQGDLGRRAAELGVSEHGLRTHSPVLGSSLQLGDPYHLPTGGWVARLATGASRSPKESCVMDPRTPSDDVQVTGTLPAADPAMLSSTEEASVQRPSWVSEARDALGGPGRHLAYEDDGRRVVINLEREWTRIGRSLAADVRFDDSTVSRRHALIVCQADGVRVLDDRSLNGVYVNGNRVEWSPLADGDRISVGRHTLWFLDTAAVEAASAAAPLAAAD